VQRKSIALSLVLFSLLYRYGEPASPLFAETGEWWIGEAETSLLQGKCGKASSYLAQAEETLPQDPRIPLYRGLCAFLEGKYALAEKELHEVINHFPQARIPYAFVLMELDQPRQARQILQGLEGMSETILIEIADALALLKEDPNAGVSAINQIVKKYKEFRGELLYFRALYQLRMAQKDSALNALKASAQLKKEESDFPFIERTLNLVQGSGEGNRRFYADLYLDTLYQTNVTRVPEGDSKVRWFQGVLRGRGMARTLSLPWQFIGFLWVDQMIPYPSPPEVTRSTDTQLGTTISLAYRVMEGSPAGDILLDGEPRLTLIEGEPAELDLALRPSLNLAFTPESGIISFYEFGIHRGFRKNKDLPSLPTFQDLIEYRVYEDFHRTQSHRIGARFYITGAHPRIYLSPFLAYRLETSSRFPALNNHGPQGGVQFSFLPFLGVIVQGGASSELRFFPHTTGRETLVSGWSGIGFHLEEWKFIAMIGGGYDALFSSITPYRNAMGFLRIGGYF
jgi:tetratricopeptide (TPR) repeat protein